MIVHVDPVFFADIGVDDKSAVVILMGVVHRFSDVVLCKRGVGHIGEFVKGNIAVVGFHDIFCCVLHR